ncbi:MAG: hypothetical protein QOG91_373 [Candidatus Parcubacteria bacterium]|nr:hypothetical protein [Candidatus Parcubacteria bacterium]
MERQHFLPEKSIHRAIVTSLNLTRLTSLLEVIGGILFFFTGTLTRILGFLINGELIEDPTDFVANRIQHLLPYFSLHAQAFAAFYLLSHGVIKIFLIINLLRNKLWAYPATITVLFIFIAYQIYRIAHTFSTFLVLLTLFDALIIVLTWHEYDLVKKSPLS